MALSVQSRGVLALLVSSTVFAAELRGAGEKKKNLQYNLYNGNKVADDLTHILGLSDAKLYELASGGKKIGKYCYIHDPASGACNKYVKGRRSPTTGYDGVPRTTEDKGTGCIKDDASSFCFFYDTTYPLTDAERSSMCTSNQVANAAAQLRYGIENGYCNDLFDPVECDPLTDYAKYLLELSDVDLYNLASNGKSIGRYCQVRDPDGGACDKYVSGRPDTSTGYDGIPRTTGGLGTGCVDTTVPCYYSDPAYPLTETERASMCTADEVVNAAGQLRFGIRNGFCNDKCVPLEGPTAPVPTARPTSAPTPNCPVEITPDVEYILSLSDQDLYDIASNGKMIGDYCYVADPPTGACDKYVKGRPDQSTGYDGVPLTIDGKGTGCVKGDASRFCYFNDPNYPLTSEERAAMCTSDAVGNAASQLRYGIENGLCTEKCEPLICNPVNSYAEYLLELSDVDLYNLASNGNVIGDFCRIVNPVKGACDKYVKGRPDPSTNHNGIPRTTGGLGSGCVDTTLPCYYSYNAYPLTSAERSAMCTSNEVANAAAQLRYGIKNGLCTGHPCIPLQIKS